MVGVSDSKCAVFNRNGFDLEKLLSLKSQHKSISPIANNDNSIKSFPNTLSMMEWLNSNAKQNEYDIYVDGSPGCQMGQDSKETERNASFICVENALSNRKCVVLANKSPLVFEWDRLHNVVNKTNSSSNSTSYSDNGAPTMMLYSAAVCSGLPVVNILKRDLLPFISQVSKIEGIFNSTSNYILSQMHKPQGGGDGDSENINSGDGAAVDGQAIFDATLKKAQELGIAEADPTLDVDGWDTAYKLFIILKTIGIENINVQDINVKGLRTTKFENNKTLYDEICQCKKDGMKMKLIATAIPPNGEGNENNDKWLLSVGLKKVDLEKEAFLANCETKDVAIVVENDLFHQMSFKTNAINVTQTSAAVLRDIVTIGQEMNKYDLDAKRV